MADDEVDDEHDSPDGPGVDDEALGGLGDFPLETDDIGERPVDRAHERAKQAMDALNPGPKPRDVSNFEHAPRRFQTIVLLLIGAVCGAFGVLTWQVEPTGRTVEGVVGVIDGSASAISLSEPAEMADRGLGIVGVLWRDADADGEWARTLSDDGHPTCLGPDSAGQSVRIGLVADPGGGDRPPAESVVWLECFTPDTG